MEIVQAYLMEFVREDHPRLRAIREEEHRRCDIQPSIGPEVGRLLGLLIRLTGATRVLELGTCLGYSTVWLAEALNETGGHVISIEWNEELYTTTLANLAAAGLADCVDVRLADAREAVRTLSGPFDLILQDADKRLYPELLEDCIRLLRPGGLLIADDALFKPMGVAAPFSDPVDAYNRRVFQDPRLYSTLLPIGDGVAVSLKLPERPLRR